MIKPAPNTLLALDGAACVPLRLADQAYARLKAALFDLALLPGQVFTEAGVVDALGMSRTPVRQALQRLAQEGFVEVSSRQGWRVHPFDFERFDRLYDLRIVLELAAVDRLCALPHIERLPAFAQQQAIWGVPTAQRLGVGKQAALLDEAFHMALLAMAGNPEMAAVHQEVTEKISVVRRLDFHQSPRIEATYEEHQSILQAIAQQQPQEAKSKLQAHIEASKKEVRNITLHGLHTYRQSSWSAL